MPARLNRRRYREVVTALKEVLTGTKPNARQKLQAATVLLEVYRRHDETERRKEVLKQRAGGPGEPVEPEASERLPAQPQTREEAERAAREFLDRIKQRESATHVN
jgi:hypothetical protein